MADYEPIDLSSRYNVGLPYLGDEGKPAIGQQSFRGLPFAVGDDAARCFVGLSDEDSEVAVEIGRPAHRVIFAHRLVSSDIPDNGPVGLHVADYVFTLAGGEEIAVPIREKFEISSVVIVPQSGAARIARSMASPGVPSQAVTDGKHVLPHRTSGPWDSTGRRQTEVFPEAASSYYLWSWTNPTPGAVVEFVRIVPRGAPFVVAAITLSHVEEHPFARQGARPARITLKDDARARQPFDLDVEVDRGDATYAYPLPEASAAEFLDGYYKGWGEEQNESSASSYVEVSAVPSATVTVKQGGEEVGRVRWGEVESSGSDEDNNVRVELVDPGKNWVRVKVLDDDTGAPVPCRVHFRSPEGVPYQPHGHHNHVNSNMETWHIDVGGDLRMGQITYAYIDGTCQGWLPRGDVLVDVARGFEYEPLRTRVRIEPGQQDLTLRIKRWTNMSEKGWYSGDSHVHFLGTQGAHTEALGEDLNVVNLLQSQWGGLFTNREDFTGAPSISKVGNSIVYTSQENRQHFMGHMILWGLKQPVMPWCSDGPSEGELGGTMETTLSHWADEAHEQGGYVVNPHFPSPNGEPAALVATGRLDAVEMIRMGEYNHNEYYRYLSAGYRLPLVGGTDKMSSDVPVGLYRTYARLGDREFTYENWCRAVAEGKTVLSGGPIIHLSVDGREVGDTLELQGPGTVEVEAWAESTLPIHTLEIVQAGRVVASSESGTGTRRLTLKEKIKVEGHTWLAARCGGPGYYGTEYLDVWMRGMFAHTSPIYVACGGEWSMFNEGTAGYMMTLMDAGLDYIREGSAQHAHGSVTHHHGEDDHVAYLERPFLEGQAAVRERMRKAGVGG